MIYDLPNTYFEGNKEGSEKARHGKGKERRSDARLLSIAMIAETVQVIYVKKSSEPEREVSQIYEALNYKDRPFWQKKSVLPESGKQTNEVIDAG